MNEILCSCICKYLALTLCHAPWTPTMQAELTQHGCPVEYETVSIGAAESCDSPITPNCSGWQAYDEPVRPGTYWKWRASARLEGCHEVTRE